MLHDLEQAVDIADRVILVSDGRITAAGTPVKVMTAERLSATGRRSAARVDELAEPVLLSA